MKLLAALLALTFTATTGNPRPCLGACRLTFGKCYTQTTDAAKRKNCLKAYETCSNGCHEKAGTAATPKLTDTTEP